MIDGAHQHVFTPIHPAPATTLQLLSSQRHHSIAAVTPTATLLVTASITRSTMVTTTAALSIPPPQSPPHHLQTSLSDEQYSPPRLEEDYEEEEEEECSQPFANTHTHPHPHPLPDHDLHDHHDLHHHHHHHHHTHTHFSSSKSLTQSGGPKAPTKTSTSSSLKAQRSGSRELVNGSKGTSSPKGSSRFGRGGGKKSSKSKLDCGGKLVLSTAVKKAVEASVPRKKSKSENRARKALRTISFILGAFIICWTPYHILALWEGFCGSSGPCVNRHIFYFTYFLCYANR